MSHPLGPGAVVLQPAVIPSVTEEFSGADLGHVWRDKRLMRIASALACHPEWSLPKLFPDPSELEAAYRFFSNGKVAPDEVLRPHWEATLRRGAGLGRRVVCAHDITELRWQGEARRGLGHLARNGQGFLLHASLLVDPLDRKPLGLVGSQFWYPEEPEPGTTRRERSNAARKVPREQKRSILWDSGVEQVEKRNAGSLEIVHVGDRECDDFAFLAVMHQNHIPYVVRSQGERKVMERGGETVLDVAKQAPVVMRREVPVGERRQTRNGRPRTEAEKKLHPPRAARVATLEVQATSVMVKKSPHAQTECKQIQLNLVLVREIDPPKGEEPIEWLLYTSEPVATAEEVGWVVDAYVCRWRIEEYFKALKTGCRPEKRQLESSASLERLLAVLLPIAWRLLVIRSLARDPAHTERPASAVFGPLELRVLRTMSIRVKLTKSPTLRQAYLAVAGLGGHLKRNGEPGWHTLGFGFERLLEAVAVVRGLEATQTCDQS